MKWYRYPSKISHSTNIIFVVELLVCIIAWLYNSSKWYSILIGAGLIVMTYIGMVILIKILVWDKEK